MRSLFFSALLCAVSSICLFSCQKEIELTNTNAPQALVHTQNQLQFKNLEEFYTKLSSFNNISDADFEKWEKMQGFESSYSFYNKIMSEFSKISTQEAFDAFMNKYEGKIRVNSENELEVINYNPFYSKLLNTKNEVLIDAKLYIYHPQNLIVISDSNSEKIELAMRLAARTLAEPIEEEGVSVSPYVGSAFSQRACANPIEKECLSGDGDYRLKYSHEIQHFATYNNATYRYDNVHSKLVCFTQSQKKNFLGIWGAHRTPITWAIGWTAYAHWGNPNTVSGGTGWTGSASSSQLSYNIVIGNPVNGVNGADLTFYRYSFTVANISSSITEVPSCGNYYSCF